MRLPEVSIRAIAPTVPTTSLRSPTWGAGGAFGALMGEVRGEVLDFIEHGSGAGASSATALSAEGQALRAALPTTAAAAAAAGGVDDAAQQAFLTAIAPWAEEAGERLGVAPHLVAAHAALESGWGRQPLRQADGSDTHNLFGIKAGGAWQGDVANALTTEYEGSTNLKKVERFRSYPDAGSAFRDYAQLLAANPRYSGALNAGTDARAFAQGLARGGYATDPAYADKLVRLAAKIQNAD